jgi:aryl-alcohol dehydrogenase-like predicted oxidoreductase
MKARFSEIVISGNMFAGKKDNLGFAAKYDLFIIREAWEKGVDFEDLADGFGSGNGTMGDWSGIRDSSPNAINKMFERALNHFFPE